METFHIALFKFSFLVIVAIESIMMYIYFYILPLLFIKYVTSIECLVSLLSEKPAWKWSWKVQEQHDKTYLKFIQ